MLVRRDGIRYAMAEGGGASSSPAPNGQDGNHQTSTQQQQQISPEEQTRQEIERVWEKPAEKDDGQQQQQQGPTPEQIRTALDSHIQGMNLMEGVDTDAIMQGLSESNPEALVGALKSTAENTVRNLIPTMAQLIDNKVESAMEAAVSQARGATQADLAFQKMGEKLPFTKGKAISPVARAVMKQAMAQGKSEDEAVDFVSSFFKEVHRTSAKDLGIQTPPRNRPGRNPSQTQAAVADISEEGEDVDWEGLFKGMR